MASINSAPRPLTTTHEGAPARRIALEAELRRTVMACLLWENGFYEGGVAVADRLAALVPQITPERVAELAREARQRMHLRHVPLFLTVQLLAGTPEARRVAGPLIPDIIGRADELTELLALWWRDGRRPLPKQLKRGLAQAFLRLDEHQLAKYNRDKTVRLRDVLFLTHPKPKDADQAAVFARLASRSLATPDTWEVALSAATDKHAAWTRLLTERKLGALALLRNLRNMTAARVDRTLVVTALREADVTRVLPFRFVAAARRAPDYEPELEEMLFRGLQNMTRLPGHTALLVDTSGSMDAALSERSDLSRRDAAAALAVLLREIGERVTIFAFADRPTLLPARRGFALVDAITRAPSGGTDVEVAKRAADADGYDRIIIVTDEQSRQPLSAPHGRGYVINVATDQHGIGYGAWHHIDGWSEAVVSYIMEHDREEAPTLHGAGM